MTPPRDPSDGIEPYRPTDPPNDYGQYPTEPLPPMYGQLPTEPLPPMYGQQPTMPLPSTSGMPQPTPPRQDQVLPYADPTPLARQAAATAGWYPDQKSGLMRWWDGAGWTEHFGPQVAPALGAVAPKDMTVAYLLAIFLGGLGVHRFYLGRIGTAVTMLLLTLFGWLTSLILVGYLFLAAVWVWQIVDLFLIPGIVREHNGIRRY